jgi:hypothetical protein
MTLGPFVREKKGVKVKMNILHKKKKTERLTGMVTFCVGTAL